MKPTSSPSDKDLAKTSTKPIPKRQDQICFYFSIEEAT